ncbi:hypothetical protein JXA70_05105 [candidate division KSB1 bacterium]|nr:hypothetical protein [candidate division KSB1 bacterium]
MKTIVKAFLIFLFVCILVCTENPLFDDNKMTGNVIKGQVLLKDKTSDHCAYVWLEGFDVGAMTEKTGTFQLDLSTSKHGGGLVGQFHLYFYVNNYQLESATVLIHNGTVQPNAGDLDAQFNLKKTITLTKILDIETIITPDIVSTTFEDSLHLTVTLRAYQDTVKITTKIRDAEYLTAAFIRGRGNDSNVLLIDYGGTSYSQIPVLKDYKKPDYKRQFYMSIPFAAQNFVPGEYEIIPYLMVSPINVPAGLLNSLTRNQPQLSTDFLNIPISENSGFFRIN